MNVNESARDHAAPTLKRAHVPDRSAGGEPGNHPSVAACDRDRLGTMASAYRASGGIMSGDRVIQLLRQDFDQPISTLARWIVDRDVVSFELQGQIWLPMFQFGTADRKVRPGVMHVIRELRAVFDDWELAEWFAQPNSSLRGEVPATVVLHDERAVLEAARVDRFVAAG